MFFTIIIPTYNRANFISTAIKSIISQTYKNWELIIIDDGSTDNTKELIETYIKKDKRIIYIYQQNAERSVARNKGIQNAKGEYICFLDSDDYYDNNYLEILYEEITKTGQQKAVYSTGYKTVINNGVISSKPLPSGYILDKLLEDKSVTPIIQCVHSYILQEYLFDKNISLWEDTHLFFRIFSKYPCYSINKYLINVVVHQDSTVYKGFKNVKIEDVDRYINAIKDLEINFFANSKKHKRLLHKYAFSKLQMYIYKARLNRQYKLVNSLIRKYFFDYITLHNILYFTITIFKNNFSYITHIQLK